jgi:hypothetical protein
MLSDKTGALQTKQNTGIINLIAKIVGLYENNMKSDVNMQICKYADMRMCGCADVRMCGCADVRMCGCADVRMCGNIRE